MQLVEPLRGRFLVHVDLHETTDSDESEFRPALAARDGQPYEPGEIPDGFYLVDDSANPRPAFQQAVIDARSEEHTSELQSLMRISSAVFCLNKKTLSSCRHHFTMLTTH